MGRFYANRLSGARKRKADFVDEAVRMVVRFVGQRDDIVFDRVEIIGPKGIRRNGRTGPGRADIRRHGVFSGPEAGNVRRQDIAPA